MPNFLTPLRRIAEAISARLCYDFLCFKGTLMDEGYLTHSVSDILCAFYGPHEIQIMKGYRHPSLSLLTSGAGRKPEVDYAAVKWKDGEVVLAVEAKWAGSSHCTPMNIIWDLVRLKLIKEQYPKADCGLLIAGHKRDTDKLFAAKIFQEGTQHPLRLAHCKPKQFLLRENKDHQKALEREIAVWLEAYPGLGVPSRLFTQLEESSISAHSRARFVARCWRVW